MDKGFAYICLQVLLLAVLFEKGQCIKCYVCSSTNDPNCYDPMASKMKPSECSSDLATATLTRFRSVFSGLSDVSTFYSNLRQDGSFTCIKVDTVLPGSHGNSTIIRGCQFERSPADEVCKMLSVKSQGSSFLKFCEICNSEACNAADPMKRSSALVTILFSVLGILYYFSQ